MGTTVVFGHPNYFYSKSIFQRDCFGPSGDRKLVLTLHGSINQVEINKFNVMTVPCADTASGRSLGSYEIGLGSVSMSPLFKPFSQCMVPVHSLTACSQTSDIHMHITFRSRCRVCNWNS